MADFQLSTGTDTFDFDIAGNVSQSGTQIGTWTVNSDNTIGISRTAGAASSVPVDWGFNANNQFELRQSGVVKFNFHGKDKVRPDLSLDHAVLNIAPDGNGDFSFGVHGDWSVDSGMNLILPRARWRLHRWHSERYRPQRVLLYLLHQSGQEPALYPELHRQMAAERFGNRRGLLV